MATLLINQLLESVTTKVFGARALSVLTQPPLNISCNPGIKGTIGAKDNVNMPVHLHSSLGVGFCVNTFDREQLMGQPSSPYMLASIIVQT